MTRHLPRPLLTLALMLIWASLWSDYSAGTLAFGLAVGIALPLAASYPPRPLRRPLKAAAFAALVAWDILTANIAVARLILTRRNASLQPALITLPITLVRPESITLLAAIITLTPSTLTAEVAADRRSLLIHCLDAPDPQAIIAQTLDRYETRIREFME